ncbi:MAG: rhamnogalacturonan acetylesterase [Ignavibacteriae bacterium]|nr:rhamnogalacturonan acetylesterase [Ignavibacteriota bacterium]
MKNLTVIYIAIISLILTGSQLIDKEINIFLAGDSTIAEKLPEKRPETGWGEKFGSFFKNNIKIKNHAKNGRSTKTFIGEGRWQAIIDSLSLGDYVMIQFGHNDESKDKGERYTPPKDFKNNLAKFVNETRLKNAIPVLITPVMRRRFDENGKFYDVHGAYPDLVRRVSDSLKVDLLDLHRASEQLFIDLGEEGTKEIFLILNPGDSANYPEGIEDNTHFSDYGAKVIANLVAEEIKKSNIGLKKYLNF